MIFQLSWVHKVFFSFSFSFLLNVVSCQPNWLTFHSPNSIMCFFILALINCTSTVNKLICFDLIYNWSCDLAVIAK